MIKRSLNVKIFLLSGALISWLILSLTQVWALDPCLGRVCKADKTVIQRKALNDDNNLPLVNRFDFYVLALTWSPEFCQRSRNASQQCAENKNLGFVVHGLWPQYYHGYPLYCSNETYLSQNNTSQALKQFPSEKLARYEWRKHGVCSGKTLSGYLEDISIARRLFKIPQALLYPKDDRIIKTMTLYEDFLKVNASLHSGMFSINCRNGALAEVRVCISKNLRHYQLCPQVLRNSCKMPDIFIPSSH